jgi:hypothetical protein
MQQTMPGKSVDRECDLVAIRKRERRAREIDLDLGSRARKELRQRCFVDHDGKQAILE